MKTSIEFEYLLGETLSSIQVESDEIIFTLENGEQYKLYHEQDCCEQVYVEDIDGDVSDLIGSPLLLVKESSNSDDPPASETYGDSHTWTFYKMSTNRGSVTIRFYGTSNGYYSERVSFCQLS